MQNSLMLLGGSVQSTCSHVSLRRERSGARHISGGLRHKGSPLASCSGTPQRLCFASPLGAGRLLLYLRAHEGWQKPWRVQIATQHMSVCQLF